MLDCQRGLFQLPRDAHYLNAAYMSPLLRAVEEAGIAGIRRKRFPADIDAHDFFRDADTLRQRFAALIGSQVPERVAVLPAVSYGVAAAARNSPIAAGQNLVLTAGQFPSNDLVWRRLARERGAGVRTIEPPAGMRGRGREWNERILEAIDADTAAVAIGPVHWTDGTRFDLVRIGARCREVGAAFVIDGTQAVGAAPFDLSAIGADAVVCATYKWLLGPYSLALGWFGPRYDGGVPLEEAWLARSGSDDFRGLVHPAEEYRPAAARYDVGGRSNFILLPMAITALEQVLAWRPDRIEAYCREICKDLFAGLSDYGFEVDEEAGRSAHLFGIRAPDTVDLGALDAELRRRRVYVSLRGSAIRVSPHLYNDADDLAALRDALVRASEAGPALAPS